MQCSREELFVVSLVGNKNEIVFYHPHQHHQQQQQQQQATCDTMHFHCLFGFLEKIFFNIIYVRQASKQHEIPNSKLGRLPTTTTSLEKSHKRIDFGAAVPLNAAHFIVRRTTRRSECLIWVSSFDMQDKEG